jgi:hypothetical protein
LAFAQNQPIPAAVVTKVDQLSDAEKKQVADYVASNSANLLSSDKLLVKKDREALVQPLTTQGISVSFRIAYDREVMPKIAPMLNAGAQMVVINGLIIAGELATDNSIALVQQKIGDKEPAIRFDAGYALNRAFQAVVRNQPAAQERTLSAAVRGLEAAIAGEKDPRVLDAFVRAGLAAAEKDSLRDDAVSAVSKGMIQAAKQIGNPGEVTEVEVMLRASAGIGQIAGQAVQRRALNQDAAKNAAELGGVLISRIDRVVDKKQLPLTSNSLREAYSQLAAAAQTLVQFSGQNLQPGGSFQITDKEGRPILLNSTLKLGTVQGDASFREDLKKIIGPEDGLLEKAPFEIPAEKFR